MVYIDELVVYQKRVARTNEWAHLTADSVQELHAFAARLGLKRRWFQNHNFHPHYDLTKSLRALALKCGAKFVPAKWQAAQRLSKAGLHQTRWYNCDRCNTGGISTSGPIPECPNCGKSDKWEEN